MKEFVEKLISRLEEIYNRNNKQKKEAYEEQEWERFDFFTHRNEGIYIAMAIINKLAEEYNNGWIPCSERLPERNTNVIAQFSSGVVSELLFNEKGLFRGFYEYGPNVIVAWQPLPQPYKPQESEWKNKVMKHFTKVE